MKKLALLLAALLSLSALFYGCNGKPAEEAPAPSASENEAAAPSSDEEIIAHNLKLDPSSINLIQFDAPAADAKTVTLKTSEGDIKIVLYPEQAPKAVENFLKLAEQGYYNGVKFYEAISGVRVSTGDPDNTGNGGKSSLENGAKFEDEYSTDLWHFNGAVAMNNGGAPGENGSRFYIVQNSSVTTELADKMLDVAFPEKVVNKYLEVGGVPNYDFRDTVFGQVIEGMEVVNKIASTATDEAHKPEKDIVINSVEVK